MPLGNLIENEPWNDCTLKNINTVLLFLYLVNDTDEVGPSQTVDISDPDTTKWILRDLEPLSRYKFNLRSCTTVGCGPVVIEECTTTLETSEWWSVQEAASQEAYFKCVCVSSQEDNACGAVLAQQNIG